MSRVGFYRAVAIGFVAAGLLSVSAIAADSGPKVDTSKPTPVIYPQTSQVAGEEGVVIMNVYVTSHGKPQQVDVAKSSGYADLDNAAVETALNWHYVPAIRDGDTVPAWAAVQVVYKLPGAAGAAAQSAAK